MLLVEAFQPLYAWFHLLQRSSPLRSNCISATWRYCYYDCIRLPLCIQLRVFVDCCLVYFTLQFQTQQCWLVRLQSTEKPKMLNCHYLLNHFHLSVIAFRTHLSITAEATITWRWLVLLIPAAFVSTKLKQSAITTVTTTTIAVSTDTPALVVFLFGLASYHFHIALTP